MVRNRHESAPYIPATGVRFRWLEKDDWAEQILRERMQEGGPGLYVLWNPLGNFRQVVEAYYPDELRHPSYREPKVMIAPDGEKVTVSGRFDPFQYDDFRCGRLCVIHLFDDPILSPCDMQELTWGLRAGNRAARSYYERGSGASWRKALENLKEEQMEAEVRKYDPLIDQIASDFAYNPYGSRY